ncbi:MAG: hypothetical protein QW743_00990 [Candidatus Methanomethylicia archaeon]
MKNPSLIENRTFRISISAAFAALSAILTALPLSIPFPVIPYLKFDVAEIPVMIAFLTFGTFPGIVSSITLWIILNVFGSWVPIGPAMKFAAIISTIIGIWIASGFKNAPIEYFTSKTRGILMLIGGATLRVMVMGIFNYIILWWLFPFFIDIAVKSITLTTGINIATPLEKLFWIMAFTALFNILHTIISIIPSLAIAKIIRKM